MSKQKVCLTNDLITNSGICVLLNEDTSPEQVALFYVPETEEKVFAINNWDPIGQANVLSRGIVCSIKDELAVASPLYKQHFSLISGQCLDDDASVKTYKAFIDGDAVYIQ